VVFYFRKYLAERLHDVAQLVIENRYPVLLSQHVRQFRLLFDLAEIYGIYTEEPPYYDPLIRQAAEELGITIPKIQEGVGRHKLLEPVRVTTGDVAELIG
jgi:hypothetical protein